MKTETWLPISVAPKYEINQRGDVRNIKTGRILKPWIRKDRGSKQVSLYIGGRCNKKNFCLASLLWLTHGIVAKRSVRAKLVPVIISRENEKYCFDSCSQAAQFLARREHYSVSGVRHHLSKRREELKDWRINYQR
ncbi:MAG: hypothetical protein IKP64_00385 [Selenomonadaceae bacterium]|nr:hypothetical protein [Selenomonadaceae bacterium]